MFSSEQPLVSLERLVKLVLSILERVVERRTAVHPVCAFTSLRRDCVRWNLWCVEGWLSQQFVLSVELMVHCLIIRSCSNSYQVRGSFEKIGSQLLVTRNPLRVHIMPSLPDSEKHDWASFYRSDNGKWNGSENDIINWYGYYCSITTDIPHVWHRLVANVEMNSYN